MLSELRAEVKEQMGKSKKINAEMVSLYALRDSGVTCGRSFIIWMTACKWAL